MVNLGFLLFKSCFPNFFFATCENELWMVDLGFLLFSCPVPSTVFYSKTCNDELWMVRLWTPTFLVPFSFQSFYSKTCSYELWMVRLRFPLFPSHFPFQACFSDSCKNLTLDGRSWIPTFLIFIGLYSFRFKNLQFWGGKIVDSNFSRPIFLKSFLLTQLQEWTLDG